MSAPSATATRSRFVPVGLALFCLQLDYFSLSLALPKIATELGSSVTDLQWLVSAYLLAFGSLLVPAGRLGDLLPRRTVLLTGVAIFGLTSLVCGLTSSVAVLIGARALQGVGAALIMPTAFALVTNATTVAQRPKVFGFLLGISGVGTALGPVVGGVFAGTIGWRWVFWFNVPVVLVVLLASRVLPVQRPEATTGRLARLDRGGVVLVAAGLAALSLGLDAATGGGLDSPRAWVGLLVGVALLAVFWWHESRAAEPLIRPDLVRNRDYTVVLLAATVANVGLNVYVVLATISLQDVRGTSAASSGLLFTVASLGLAVSGPVSGWLVARLPAPLALAGATVLGGLAVLATGVVTWLPGYVVSLGLAGFFCGMGFSVGLVAVQVVLPAERSAEGTSLLQTGLICGGGIAVVVATGVAELLGDGGRATVGSLRATLTGTAVLLVVVGLVLAGLERRRAGMGISSSGRAA